MRGAAVRSCSLSSLQRPPSLSPDQPSSSGAKPWRMVFSVTTRGLDELQQVVGAAGLGADAGEPEAAERLAPDERAGDAAVDVDVAGSEPRAVASAMRDGERENSPAVRA